MRNIIAAFLLLATANFAFAQSESELKIDKISDNYAYLDGLLFDISIPQLPQLPAFDPQFLLGPDMKDYSAMFQPDTRWTFGKEHTFYPNSFSSSSFFPFSGQQLQKATYKVNDQMRLSLYGQYEANGRRTPNTNALPWNRDAFVGGMELRFNKNFGMRIEVRQGGRNPMNPYP